MFVRIWTTRILPTTNILLILLLRSTNVLGIGMTCVKIYVQSVCVHVNVCTCTCECVCVLNYISIGVTLIELNQTYKCVKIPGFTFNAPVKKSGIPIGPRLDSFPRKSGLLTQNLGLIPGFLLVHGWKQMSFLTPCR